MTPNVWNLNVWSELGAQRFLSYLVRVIFIDGGDVMWEANDRWNLNLKTHGDAGVFIAVLHLSWLWFLWSYLLSRSLRQPVATDLRRASGWTHSAVDFLV